MASRGRANQLELPSVHEFHQECKKYGPQAKQLRRATPSPVSLDKSPGCRRLLTDQYVDVAQISY